MPESVDVLIIGGGLAGLSAALELKSRGRSVRVLEAEADAGGKVRSVARQGRELPRGPSSFSGRHTSLWRLLELVGLTEKAKLVDPGVKKRFIVRDGSLRGIEQHPVSLLTTRALSWGDRMTLLREAFKAGAPIDGESLDAFFRRRFSDELTDAVAAAVVTGIYAGDLTQLGAAACFPALVEWEREHGSVLKGAIRSAKPPATGAARRGIFRLEGGLGRIGVEAKARLDLVNEARVDRLYKSPDGWTVQFGGFRQHARTVLIATEAPIAADLLGTLAPAASKLLAGLRYAPMAVVHWRDNAESDSKLPVGFGYLAPPREKLFALGTLCQADLSGEKPRWFSSFVGGTREPEKVGLSDEQLLRGVQADLRQLTQGQVGQLLHVERWQRAVFQPPVNHAEVLREVRAALSGTTLNLAGSYLGGGAMKDAVESGFEAAEALNTQLGGEVAQLPEQPAPASGARA